MDTKQTITPVKNGMILNKREENFLKAHHVINSSDLSKAEVIEKILGFINETNS